jgi:hypothetical protein
LHYDTMVAQAASWRKRAQFELDTEYFVLANVDEVALVFGDERRLEDFVDWCIRVPELDNFNSVQQDTMHMTHNEMTEFPTQDFDVRFEFLSHEDWDWRIEAMCVLSGSAPLHTQALEEYGEGAPIHVSWKCDTLEDYQARVRTLDHPASPTFQKLPRLAEYTNSYGRFSYFGALNILPYFKPRVNLRDT